MGSSAREIWMAIALFSTGVSAGIVDAEHARAAGNLAKISFEMRPSHRISRCRAVDLPGPHAHREPGASTMALMFSRSAYLPVHRVLEPGCRDRLALPET